jgi:DNA excision repair protein ERCC-2
VDRYLAWAVRVADGWRRRDASLAVLEFPFGVFRPGQLEMADAVRRTLRAGGRIFIQAPTGIGKTMAVLFPAVITLAEGLSRKIFYLTARTTGRQAAEKALEELRRRGMRLKSLALTAKERICFQPGGACTPEECGYAKGHYDRLPDARAEMFESDAWTRDAVEEIARRRQVCPFDFSLELSLWADLIVCDYNYAFDPKAYLRRFFLEGEDGYVFLIDEAHNLVDRSREMFSAEIRKQPYLSLRRSLKSQLPAVHRHLGRINAWMLSGRKRCLEDGNPRAEASPPESLGPLLKDFINAAAKWLEKNEKAGFREELLERYFESNGFLRVAERFDETYAALSEALPKDFRLKLFCIDPSRQFAEALQRCRAAVFFSATLTPLDFFKDMLGGGHADCLVLPSPFPPENLRALIANRISTLYRHRERTRTAIARLLEAFVGQRPGNYLLFFPSYEYLRMIRDAVRRPGPSTEFITQEPGMGERQREAFLARFDTERPGTLVGFAVMGGIFGEGIDLVGRRLSGAAVVGVGLPAVCLERDLIRAYFAEQRQEGFEYAYVYPGINRVLQAAGRVIRSETDRGAVLLIDQRYGMPGYRALLPESWRPAFVADPDRLAENLKDFWAAAKPEAN